MAKPLRIREILEYLLDIDPNTNKPRLSQNQISRTLGVSAVTVRRIDRALTEYEKDNSSQNLSGKSDIELKEILLPSENAEEKKRNIIFLDKDCADIIDALKKDGSDLTSIYKDIHSLTGPSLFSLKEDSLIRDCSYITLYHHIRGYIRKMGYSDRLKFKPGEFLEIGVIPLTAPVNRKKTKNPDSLTTLQKEPLLLYLYLPFSRETAMYEFDAQEPYFTRDIITALILFFTQTNGLPAKIIGEDRIEKVFKKADLKLLKEYLRFCGLMYSSDKRHCVFKDQESDLIERTIKVVKAKKTKGLSFSHQKRIDDECFKHNKEKAVKIPFNDEKEKLHNKQYPQQHFIYDLGVRKLQENNYIKFADHWYSSNYSFREPRIALEFNNGEVYFITKDGDLENEVILSRHTFIPGNGYSTNPEDLAPDDETASKYNLWTTDYIIQTLEKRFMIVSSEDTPTDPIRIAADHYIASRPYQQQAYKMLISLSRVDVDIKDLEKVRDYLKELLNKESNGYEVHWGKELYDLFKELK